MRASTHTHTQTHNTADNDTRLIFNNNNNNNHYPPQDREKECHHTEQKKKTNRAKSKVYYFFFCSYPTHSLYTEYAHFISFFLQFPIISFTQRANEAHKRSHLCICPSTRSMIVSLLYFIWFCTLLFLAALQSLLFF